MKITAQDLEDIKKTPTSRLILLTNPEVLGGCLFDEAERRGQELDRNQLAKLLEEVMTSICDELDRRFPVSP